MEDAEALVAELQAKSAISLVATKVNTSSREELLRLLAGFSPIVVFFFAK